MGNGDRKDWYQTYRESVVQHNELYAKQKVEYERRKAKEKEEEKKEKERALQQKLEQTRIEYEEKRRKEEEIRLEKLEEYKEEQRSKKRLELLNRIDECQKIIIIAACIALVPLVLIVINLESLGVMGTIILAFIAIFVVLGKGTNRFLPFFLLIIVPFFMFLSLGLFVTLWWLGWIIVALGLGIVHYMEIKKCKQELTYLARNQ